VPKTIAILGSALFFAVEPCTLAGLVPWWMTRWEADPSCLLGSATFVFADERDCNRFTRAALHVPGVYRELHEQEPLPRSDSGAFEASKGETP